jgi:hypothetical protein
MVGPDQERWNQVMVKKGLTTRCLTPPRLAVASTSTYMFRQPVHLHHHQVLTIPDRLAL